MTELEKKFAKMTPAQQRATKEAIGDMMGMSTKKKAPAKKTTKKK